jgi:hypothetical protein
MTGRTSPTVRYLADRERILAGRRAFDPVPPPADAARDLVALLGLLGARQWLREVWQAVLRQGNDDA